MGRVISWAVGAVVALLVVIIAAGVGAVSAVFGGGGSAATGCGTTVATPGATPDGLTAEQASNASVIVTVGQRMSVPPRGWVIAVATALQESNLINIGGGPDDSLGLFQQRPSQGWGTPQQVTNPDYAATKFYERLKLVSGWESLPLTEAAQAVQRSAYPNAYAKHEARATAIVSAVGSGNRRAIPEDLEHCLSSCPEILSNNAADLQHRPNIGESSSGPGAGSAPRVLKISGQGVARIARNGHTPTLRIAQDLPEPTSAFGGGTLPECLPAPISATGWTKPVPAPVGSGFRTGDRPGHDGVDLGAARGTVIRAASGGVVVKVVCNVAGNSDPPTGAAMPCDKDGYPGLGGCGWYAEIRHAGDIVSRYCHMVRQPSVRVGQTVAPGAPIGFVGTSGNSSGPHLHFEIHTGYPASSNNAINPVPFMIEHGAPL